MIHMAEVAVHLIWVLGVAIILAALGYYDWQAREQGILLRQALTDDGFVVAAALGLALVSLGLAGVAGGPERALWLILMLLFAAQAWRAWSARSATPS
jgi:hypothetical protein